jgi:hypothetical protein
MIKPKIIAFTLALFIVLIISLNIGFSNIIKEVREGYESLINQILELQKSPKFEILKNGSIEIKNPYNFKIIIYYYNNKVIELKPNGSTLINLSDFENVSYYKIRIFDLNITFFVRK